MDFTVDRSKWRCGGALGNPTVRGEGVTKMLNGDGFMCCLGHCAKQLDPDVIIENKNYPNDSLWNISRYDNPFIMHLKNSLLAKEAARINDDEQIDQKEREQRLRNLFKEYGHTIKFTGKSVKPKP